MATSTTSLSQATKTTLIEHHLNYVERLAVKLHQELHMKVDLDDLIACGREGLVEAAARFDPGRGVAFTTFSYYRIRGAMFDGLRRQGHLNRSQYARFRAHADAYLLNAAERTDSVPALPRSGTRAQLADLATTLDNVTTILLCSYERCPPASQDSLEPDSDTIVETKQLARLIRRGIDTLPDKERTLLSLFYYEGLSLKKAGAHLGLSKSWACRIHGRAIRMLTEWLKANGVDS